MNKYKKFAPKVYLAECEKQHEKGDEIIVETRYGKENECIVHNLIYEKDGKYYYSITRADGFNTQERAMRKAERYEEWAGKAEDRSDKHYQDSKEGHDFLVLAEPIKIGHHSEKRHRALIERNHRRMDRSMEELKKSEKHGKKAAYWGKKTEEINLSMPKSVEHFRELHEKAVDYHEGLKSGKYPKQHSYDVQYANKDRKKALKNYELAKKLWS